MRSSKAKRLVDCSTPCLHVLYVHRTDAVNGYSIFNNSLVSGSSLFVSHFQTILWQNVIGSSLRFSVLPQPVERSWKLNPPNLQLFDNLLHHLSHSRLVSCVTPAQMNQTQVHTFLTVTVELIIAHTVLLFPHSVSLHVIALQDVFDWLMVLAPRLLISNVLIIYWLVYQYFVCRSTSIFSLVGCICAISSTFSVRNVPILSFSNATYQRSADDTEPHLFFPSGGTLCEAFICGWHIHMSVNCSSLKADSALWEIFPSWLTTPLCPLLPVNNFTVIPDNQLSFIKYLSSQVRLIPIFISPPLSASADRLKVPFHGLCLFHNLSVTNVGPCEDVEEFCLVFH